MQKNTQHNDQKIPLQQFDQLYARDMLEKSARQIFYLNQMKITELQEQLNTYSSSLKVKEVTVKLYTLFENLSYVFQKLGIEELYNQLKQIFNPLSRMVVTKGQQQKQKGVDRKMMQQIDEQITEKKMLEQRKPEFHCESQKRKIKKQNKNRGIFLYNQSYYKHVERRFDKQSSCEKFDLNDSRDKIDVQEEFQRQQMLYFLSRKRQLSVFKINDHSKGYKEIQNQFRIVEEKLKIVLQNLQHQFEDQNIRQFQFLSKQQISRQLLNFNQSMRNQLVLLKEQYDLTMNTLRLENIELRNKINLMINARDSMVSTEVQTIQTVASIKRVKRLAQEYEMKIRRLEAKITETGKRQKQIQDKCNDLVAKKEKQLVTAYENLSKKQQMVNNYKMKCFNYEEMISHIEQQQPQRMEQYRELFNVESQIQQINQKVNRYKRGKKNFPNNRLNLKRRTLHPTSRNSQYSELSRQDDEEEQTDFRKKKNSPLSNQNFEVYKKSDKYSLLKKTLVHKSNNNLKNQLGEDFTVSMAQQPIKRQGQHTKLGPRYSIEKQNQKQIIDELKNGEILGKRQQEKNSLPLTELKIEQKLQITKRKSQEIKEVRRRSIRKDKTKSVIQGSSPVIDDYRVLQTLKNSISANNNQNNEAIIIGKNQSGGKIKFQAKHTVNKSSDAYKFQKTMASTKLQKQSRFKLKNQSKSMHIGAEIKDHRTQDYNHKGGEQIPTPNLPKQMKQNYQKYIAKLSNKQVSKIAQKMIQAGHIDDTVLNEIDKEYPQFLSEMKTFQTSRALYEALNLVHQKKCHKKPCHHLQFFVDFCNRFKEGINSSRTALKLHVQNFRYI